MQNKVIISIILIVVITLLFVTSSLGKQQDKNTLADYKNYENAKKLMEKGQGSEVVSILENLRQKYPKDYGIMKNLAIAYGQSGKYNEAIEDLNAALQQRPALIQSGIFCAQYADVLYSMKNYNAALPLYKNALQFNNFPQITDYLKQRIDQLSSIVKESESK